MGKRWTDWKITQTKAAYKETTKRLIPLIDDFMERNKGITSWEDLSEDDLTLLDSNINGDYLSNIDMGEVARYDLISKEDINKIKAFKAWDESLGIGD